MAVLASTTDLKTVQPPAQVDFAAVKARQRGVWSSGDYAVLGITVQSSASDCARRSTSRRAQEALDVAAGNGNASLAAARRWCDVTASELRASLAGPGARTCP